MLPDCCIYFSCCCLGPTHVAKFKNSTKIKEVFKLTESQKKHLVVFLDSIRRSFKFMNEATAASKGVLSTALDKLGYKVEEDATAVLIVTMMCERYRMSPTVYKLICMAVNEERSTITKNVKSVFQSRYLLCIIFLSLFLACLM